MKYLTKYKLFESNNLFFTQEEADDISDIFRDMVDEFDMIYYDNTDDDSDINRYLCYIVRAKL